MFSTNNLELVVMAHPLNSSAQKAEASRALWVQGHPDLRCEFLDMQGYIVRPCLTNQTKPNKNKGKELTSDKKNHLLVKKISLIS